MVTLITYDMTNKRDLELIYEMGCLRHIQRTWKQFLGADFANLAEHTLRVAWIALILAKEEKADTGHIIKLALAHDIAESRTGDVHYVSRLYTKRDENMAVADILKGTSLEEEFLPLLEEYEKRETLESKIVKDADTLDVDFELHEQAANGNSLEKQKHAQRAESVFPKLFTESAKRMWKEIETSNVHDWHFNARNRFSEGDWKK